MWSSDYHIHSQRFWPVKFDLFKCTCNKINHSQHQKQETRNKLLICMYTGGSCFTVKKLIDCSPFIQRFLIALVIQRRTAGSLQIRTGKKALCAGGQSYYSVQSSHKIVWWKHDIIFLGVFMTVTETPHVTGCLKMKNQHLYKDSKPMYLLRALFIILRPNLHLTNISPETDNLHSSGWKLHYSQRTSDFFKNDRRFLNQ